MIDKKQLGARDRSVRAHYDKTSSLETDERLKAVSLSFPKPRRLVALRIDEEVLEKIRRLAASKGLNYSTLMRMWITERLRSEIRG